LSATLPIADDVLAAAQEIARSEGKSVGDVVSELARRALRLERASATSRNGVPLLPISNPNAIVTLDIVNALRDEEP
jgi:hypothetical protein